MAALAGPHKQHCQCALVIAALAGHHNIIQYCQCALVIGCPGCVLVMAVLAGHHNIICNTVSVH